MLKGCAIAAAIVVAIPALWFGGEVFERSSAEAPDLSKPALNEMPSSMVRDYSANEAAAQRTYSAQPIRLIGNVRRVSLNATDGVIVEVADSDSSVEAHFLDSQRQWSESLRPDDAVQLICDDPYYLLGIVSLGHCVRA